MHNYELMTEFGGRQGQQRQASYLVARLQPKLLQARRKVQHLLVQLPVITGNIHLE